MTDLPTLRAQVEAASGPDRDLDKVLYSALGGWCEHTNTEYEAVQSDSGFTCLDCGADSWGNTGPTGQKWGARRPALTASLDAALALVEEKLKPELLEIEGSWNPLNKAEWPAWTIRWYPAGVPVYGKSWHAAMEGGPTPALALIKALLSALIAQGESEG